MLIFPGIINATGRVGAVEWLARSLKPAFRTTLFLGARRNAMNQYHDLLERILSDGA
jgi:hypothetical protein